MKTFSLRKILLVISVLCCLKGYSQLTGGEVFMLSPYMEVGIAPCGAFGTAHGITGSHYRTNNGHGLGFVADPEKNGWTTGTGTYGYYGDFFIPGSPVEGWAMQMGSQVFFNHNTGTICGTPSVTGGNISYNHTGTLHSAIWRSDAAFKTAKGLEICQSVSFKDGDLAFVVNVNITNTSSVTIPELYYMRDVDPDNDIMMAGNYTTKNLIVQQGTTSSSGAVVTATGTVYTGAFLGLGTLQPNSRVAVHKNSIAPNNDLKKIWDATDLNYNYPQSFTSTSDVNIALVFKQTNILPGQTIKFSYAYVLDLSVLNSALASTTGTINVLADNVDITANPQITLTSGGSVDLSIVSDPGYTWTWSPAAGLTGTTGNSQTANPSTTTTYTVVGTLTSGCDTKNETRYITVVSGPVLPCTDCIGSFAPEAGEYILSAWVKEESATPTTLTYTNPRIDIEFPSNPTFTSTWASPVGPFTASGEIIDGWQRIEGKFTIPTLPSSVSYINIKLSSNGGNCFFDDIRIHPLDGSMKSYVYDPVNLRLVAELDERNYATMYEYDEEGKLIRVKKETEKGIMTIKENKNNTKKK
jgi:hypothetical protein